MKIVFLSRYQQTNFRGVETFTRELVQRLNKKDQVEIFSGIKSDSLSDVLKGRFDVVVPLNGRIQSLQMSLGRLLGNYKVLISGHAGIGRDDLWNLVVARPDVFVALTDAELSWAKKWGIGIKLTKIPNGIDLEKFNPQGDKVKINLEGPIILSVGALVSTKQHQLVIEAVSKLKKGSLLIVGEGPEKNLLEKMGRNKLGKRFMLTRFDYRDMPSVYRSVDLFTLPSWNREAFGIVYLEAMATNIPVVAPDDNSRREIIGRGGILTQVDDPIVYAEALQRALTDKWQNLPRGQAEKFSWDKVADQYHQLFESLI